MEFNSKEDNVQETTVTTKKRKVERKLETFDVNDLPSFKRKKEKFNLEFSILSDVLKMIFWQRLQNNFPFGFDFLPYDVFNIIVNLANDPVEVLYGIKKIVAKSGNGCIGTTGEILGFPDVKTEGNSLLLEDEECTTSYSGNNGIFTAINNGIFTTSSFGNCTSYIGGMCISGNRVTIKGKTYTLPPHSSSQFSNKGIFLDGKKWEPLDDSHVNKETKRKKRRLKRKFFIDSKTSIESLSLKGTAGMKCKHSCFNGLRTISHNSTGNLALDDSSIKDLTINSSCTGKIRVKSSMVSDLQIYNSGTGSIYGEDVTVGNLGVSNSGTANISSFFVMDYLNVNNSGTGDVRLNVSEECKVKKLNSGTGKIKLE